jgi:signal transduction histidine kinase
VISGIADQVSEHPKVELQERIAMIKRNSQQLLGLINQMLDLAKLESGTLPVKMVQDDIIQYFRYLSESYHSYAESKEILLHLLTDLDEIVIDFDPEKIQTIFTNLVGNAIKFTPVGGNIYIEVHLEEPKTGAKYLSLKIKDTGKGIAESALPYIFDRFFQEDDSSTRTFEGTGIGLSLIAELVTLLGGSITVKSQEGKGTEFSVRLPASQNAKMEKASGKSESKILVPVLEKVIV